MPKKPTATTPTDVLALARLEDHPNLIGLVEERHALAHQIVTVQHDLQDLDRRISAAHNRSRDITHELQMLDQGILTDADMALGPGIDIGHMEDDRRKSLAQVQHLRVQLAESEYKLNLAQRRVRQEVRVQLASLMADLARQVALKLFDAVPQAQELASIAAQANRLLGTVQIDPLLRLGDIKLLAEKAQRVWERLDAQDNAAAD